MNKQLLQEYIYRVGVVTLDGLVQQVGAARGLLCEIISTLIEQREIFYCRLVRGEATLLSMHLLNCMRTVCCEVDLQPDAQDIYDWLSENEGASIDQMHAASELSYSDFMAAMQELQVSLMVSPLKMRGLIGPNKKLSSVEDLQDKDWCWGTVDYWLGGFVRPARYSDLGYCLSELKRMLQNEFSTREINNIIYRNQM